ncbi:MAG: ABC transporter ATP-binding protein [Elusimicrobia bacterium]|nr:ABC transporter ATP-binding protein [Elusimicrobiota bacterium]
MNNNYIIRTENITKSYVDDKMEVTVLKGISVGIRNGETVSVVGPSGAGKSTLLHIFGLMDKPSSGVISIDGLDKDMNEKILAKYRNECIGFVFQFYNLLPEFSAIENIMLPAIILGENKQDAKKKAQKLISEVELSSRSRHLPSELSGGEQQRIAIARSLINSPKILIADEPTGNLDKQTSENVINLIMQLQTDYNFTLIVATHNESIAGKFSRNLKLIDGQLGGN